MAKFLDYNGLVHYTSCFKPGLVEVVDSGAKNKIFVDKLNTTNANGVTYTINSDGTIIVNGTPSGSSPSYVVAAMPDGGTYKNFAEFCNGDNILSGCPTGGSVDKYRMYITGTGYTREDFGNGVELTDTSVLPLYLIIYIYNGYTANNLTFKPMICSKAAWNISQKFVPYRPTYEETVEQVTENENNILYNTIYGVKNLLNIPDGTYTITGLTVVATNGELTFTSTNVTTHAIVVGTFNLKAGTYVLSDRAGGAKGFDIRLLVDGENVTPTVETATFTLSEEKTAEIRFYSYNAISNQKIKPMLCLKSLYDADTSYQPYAMSNTELTAKEQTNENNISTIAAEQARNKLKYTIDTLKAINTTGVWNDNTYSINMIDFTVNDDMSISVLGNVQDTNTAFYLAQNIDITPYKTDILSGCPVGGGNDLYAIRIAQAASPWGTIAADTGDSTTIVNASTNGNVYISIRNITNALQFKPMICSASNWELTHTYQPYTMSNTELTAKEQANEDNISLLEQMNGAKNICDWANATERLRQGLSDVIKTDTSLAITSNAPWGHIAYGIGTLSAGEYVAIAKITNYSVESATCRFGIDASMASTTPISGDGVVTHSFSLNEATLIRLFFYANYTSTSYVNSYTASDIMVIPKAVYDAGFTDYQPYAMSNTELTAKEQANENNISKDEAVLVELVDSGAKNILDVNTSFTTGTIKGVTYTNNGDQTYTITTDSSGSTADDSFVQLYDVNADNLFGVKKGEKVVISSTSNKVGCVIVPKYSGGYGATIRGYKDSPIEYIIPSNFTGFLLRIGVATSGTVVDENVGFMICTKATWDISHTYQPYRPSYQELYERVITLEQANQ